MADEFINYYKLLEIEETASVDEIKKAVKNSLRKYHPDRNGETEEDIKLCTAKTAQVHNAKEILLDPVKRQEYDQQLRDEKNGYRDEESKGRRQRNRRPESSGDDYNQEETVLRKPRYVHGSTCRPYTGRASPRVFYFSKDGSPGSHGTDGRPGHDGIRSGEHGSDGTNATIAHDGSDGSDLKIYLDTVQDDAGHLEISVLASTGRDILARREEPSYSPIKTFQSVGFSCKGGRGGNGANGGRGGDGARGYNGENATQFRRGTNGGPGGNGGDGGRGTAGGHGGRGGHVEYILDANDTYLLMRVHGIDPRTGAGNMVDGGPGGMPGSHGRGGDGGYGGKGGRSYSYQVSEWRRDNNGNVYEDYKTITVDGGCSGRSGRRGHTPDVHLSHGTTGASGSVTIQVIGESIQTYTKRYDLSFQSSSHHHLSDMIGNSIFEFGETAHITSITLKNSGFMPTPKQRVMLAIDQYHGIDSDQDTRIIVPIGSSTLPGETVAATQGFLSISCPYPEADDKTSRDFEPHRRAGWVTYSALQLGPENKASLAQLSDFQAPFTRIHSETAKDEFQMAFPIENQNGIRGLRSLGAKETTFVLLTISNISNQSFGHTSGTGRALSVLFQYVVSKRYEIPVQNICVRSVQTGEVVSVRPGRGDRGYKFDIPFLAAGSDYLVQVSFRLNVEASLIRTGARAALQAKVLLDDIPILQSDGSKLPREGPTTRTIQSRLFEVSCQPKFKYSSSSDVLIVHTNANEADQIEEWHNLASRLGLEAQDYSLSRYGHMSSNIQVEDGMVTKNCFKNKLVVLLNEEYKAMPNAARARHDRHRPSQLLSSAYDFDASTHFLAVGGKLKDMDQLSPDYHVPIPNNAKNAVHKNRKLFKQSFRDSVQHERIKGFAQSERTFPQTFRVQIKVSTLFGEPQQSTIWRILSRRCTNMQKWLDQQDNLRHDKVTFRPCCPPTTTTTTTTRPMEKGSCILLRTWNIGELCIGLGVPSYQNSVVWVSEEDAGNANLSSPTAIQSKSMTHALVKALPIDKCIDCFVRTLRDLAAVAADDDEDVADDDDDDDDSVQMQQGAAVASVCRDCLVREFLSDITTYYHGHFQVEEKHLRSRTLHHLLNHGGLGELLDESYSNKCIKKVVTKQLGSLVASLRCCARSLDLIPWWNPFSRKHSTCRAMKEAMDHLEEHWSVVLDRASMEAEQKLLCIAIKSYIKKDRNKFWIRARGRYRAALEHLHSPTNVTKYPPTKEFGPMSARVRDERTMSTGSSQKRKKRSTRVLLPDENETALKDVSRRLAFGDEVMESVRKDISEYRQDGGS